jgi:hypothetical protein
MLFLATILLSMAMAQSGPEAPLRPSFAKYPAGKSNFKLTLALPRLRTPEERRFRSVLRNGIKKGYNVVEGGTENERVGPNFAGHFILVQWGCGSDCMEAAVIDGVDGTVLQLPRQDRALPPTFQIATGSADMRTLKFRTESRLLGIPNRPDGIIYYYVLEGHVWRYVGKVRDAELSF